MDTRSLIDMVEKKINYEFTNSDLLLQAFTRSSYARENGGEDNEILEWIGDKALDLAIVRLLTDRYGFYCHDCDDFDSKNENDAFCCEKSEGELTALKSRMVKKATLARRITELDWAKHLLMGQGDWNNCVFKEASVKEDLFEAIIGAVALDCNWDFTKISDVVAFMLEPHDFYNDDDNYVHLIQNWATRAHIGIEFSYREPCYLSYASSLNSKSYICQLSFHYKTLYERDLQSYGIATVLPLQYYAGHGKSKREARMEACRNAYACLIRHGIIKEFTIRDELENPNQQEAISQLEILARRGYFSIPTYDFKLEHDQNGNPIWHVSCSIAEYQNKFYATSSSKKEAKKTAAYQMLKFVLSAQH